MHDFNREPLAPLGTKVVIHKKSSVRKFWGYHRKVCWYVGPAKRYYHYYRVYVPEPSREIITDTIQFILHQILFPVTTVHDHIKSVIDDIITLLDVPTPFYNPLNHQQHEQLQLRAAFTHIVDLLNNNQPTNFTKLDSLQQPRVPQLPTTVCLALQAKNPLPDKVKLPRVKPPIPWTIPSSTMNKQSQQVLSPSFINHIYGKQGKNLNRDKLIAMPSSKKVCHRGLEHFIYGLSILI